MSKARKNVKKLNNIFLFDEQPGVTGDGSSDDTAGMQAALDAAPAGSVVMGAPGKTYKFTSLSAAKALTLDFQGAALLVSPGVASLSGGSPAIKFDGAVGTAYPLNTPAALADTVVLSTAANAGAFVAGDYIELTDLAFVPGWDASTITAISVSAGGASYTAGELVAIVGGSGSSAFGTVAVTAGAVTAITIVSGGTSFAASDALTLNAVDGSGTGATGTVTTIGGGAGIGFTGRSEINRVKSVNVGTGTLTLEKSIEWLYASASSAKVAKVTAIQSPKIINVGTVTEVDPGGTYIGTSSTGPHIFAFYRCIRPEVSGANVEGFQLHAVHFTRCIDPIVERVTASHPFRPTLGGHGYLSQFERCSGGLARQNVGFGVRHLVDWAQSYDGNSQGNVANDPKSAQFYCHGQGSKRCVSTDDAVYFGSASTGGGWASGNPQFAADYDFTIVRPRAYGPGCVSGAVFSMSSKAERTRITGPVVVLGKSAATLVRVFHVASGARDTYIDGGYVDLSGVSGNVSDSVLNVSGKQSAADPFGLTPLNITMRGTVIRGPATASSSVLRAEEMVAGYLRLLDVEIEGASATQTAIRVDLALEELEIKGHRLSGTLQYGVRVLIAPYVRYRVLDGQFKGTYATAQLSLATSTLLVRDAPYGITTIGNAGTTLTPGTSPEVCVFDTAITNNRSVSLSTTGAWVGEKFTVIRLATATGAFTVDVGTGPLKSLAVGQWCEAVYNGSAWVLSKFGSL